MRPLVPRRHDFSMRVWLKPDKLSQLGVTAQEVTAAIQEQNAQIAAGSIGAPPAQTGQTFEYIVFVKGRLTNTEEFGNVIARGGAGVVIASVSALANCTGTSRRARASRSPRPSRPCRRPAVRSAHSRSREGIGSVRICRLDRVSPYRERTSRRFSH